MKIILAALTFLAFTAFEVDAAELRYELYAKADGNLALLSSGVKRYSDKDFVVSKEDRNGSFYGTRKVLELYGGYGIGILETFDSASGFGLSVEHLPPGSNPNDFSWEWYDHNDGTEYIKRQGGSRIEVVFTGQPVTTQVQTVHYIDEAEYEYTVDICCKGSDGGRTHLLRILPGSTLEFPR